MRKISYLFALLVSFIAFNACTSDVDNYFPESAPERATKSVAEVKKTLQEASNGWRMEYYGDITYGGYNVLCKFQGDSVLIASEKAGKNHEAGLDASGNLITESSLAHFNVNQSMGVVVSFDTYNKLFHYFADPKNDDYGEAGTGFGGDFEFRVLKCTSDTIVLQGLKHGDRIYMLPMKADKDWATYLQEVEDVKKFMASSSYTLLAGNDTLAEGAQYGDYHSLIFQYPDSTGEVKRFAYPYIVTPEGYKFYQEVEIGGKKFTNFSRISTILLMSVSTRRVILVSALRRLYLLLSMPSRRASGLSMVARLVPTLRVLGTTLWKLLRRQPTVRRLFSTGP